MTTDLVIDKLILIYNADSGVIGGIRYVVDHLRGTDSCALCDITHGKVLQKKSWRQCRAQLTVPIQTLYRNQLDDRQREVTQGRTPFILAQGGGTLVALLGPEEIDACEADVDEMRARLDAAVEEKGYSYSA